MKRVALAIALCAAAVQAAFGQTLLPAPPYYATNPAAPLAPQPAGPVQQQVLQNYRTQLLQTQRSLQQSGASPADRLEVERQLNMYNQTFLPPAPAAGTSAPPAASFSPAPVAAPGAPPAPPFDAAPAPVFGAGR